MTTSDQDPGNGPERPQDGPEGTGTGQDSPQGTQDAQKADSGASGDQGDDQDPDTFPRDYVKGLRDEIAKYRTRSKRADSLATKLIHSMAAQNGRLVNPAELHLSDALLDKDGMPDQAKVDAAIDTLLKEKPYLASRKPSGDVGQGITNESDKTVSLAGLLRAGAGS